MKGTTTRAITGDTRSVDCGLQKDSGVWGFRGEAWGLGGLGV